MPTFTSNDAQINYQTFGDASKPALIFSNSLGTNYRDVAKTDLITSNRIIL